MIFLCLGDLAFHSIDFPFALDSRAPPVYIALRSVRGTHLLALMSSLPSSPARPVAPAQERITPLVDRTMTYLFVREVRCLAVRVVLSVTMTPSSLIGRL